MCGFPQSSSRRPLAPRTRVPRRRLLQDTFRSTAQHSIGARSARDLKHIHPAQRNESSPCIRASANGAYQRASAARLGRQPFFCFFGFHLCAPRGRPSALPRNTALATSWQGLPRHSRTGTVLYLMISFRDLRRSSACLDLIHMSCMQVSSSPRC